MLHGWSIGSLLCCTNLAVKVLLLDLYAMFNVLN